LEVLLVKISAKRTSREILRDYIGGIACNGDATTGLIGALYKRHKICTKLLTCPHIMIPTQEFENIINKQQAEVSLYGGRSVR